MRHVSNGQPGVFNFPVTHSILNTKVCILRMQQCLLFKNFFFSQNEWKLRVCDHFLKYKFILISRKVNYHFYIPER